MALERVDAKQVIARLSDALGHVRDVAGTAVQGRPVLAFDADGTLWRGDVGCDLFAGALERRVFGDDAAEIFRAEARSMALSEEGDVHALGHRLLDAFYQGRWEDGPAAVTMAICYAGLTPAKLDEMAKEVLAGAGLAERIHPGVVEIIAWAAQHEVEVNVVSASPIAAVIAGATWLRIPSERIIAMRTALRPDGRFAASLEGESVYGEGKVAAIDRLLGGTTLLGAFGDSAGDAFMMRRSKVPVAVGPSDKLREIAHTVPSLVELPFPPLSPRT